MPKTTISSLILKSLANDRRTVAADWRIQITYMRIALAGKFALPDVTKTRQLIKNLQTAGDIERVSEISGVYRITVPYASVLPSPDEVIIQEGNPRAVFSHFTAAQYHNLTYAIPNEYHLTHYPDSSVRLPLGTAPEDWIDVPDPRQRTPNSIHGVQIYWYKAKAEWDFGHTLGHIQGCPIYITDVERTLIDALRFPQRCGGATEVMRIWKRATDALNLDTLIGYVQKFKQTLLKQRVGFILERLGEPHPKFDEWAANSVRGSSAKLFANLEFSPHYSKRWNLSINAPDAILSEQSDC
jgi:predicted transcriptional regulator of viral defense system